MKTRLIMMLGLTLLFACVVLAADDPFSGTWKMNIAKSTFGGSAGPKRPTTNKIEVGANSAVTFTLLGVDDYGKPTKEERNFQFDGKAHPTSGSSYWDSITVKRIDARTWEEIYKKGGEVVRMARRAVLPDGKTMTFTAVGPNPGGTFSGDVIIYDKQ